VPTRRVPRQRDRPAPHPPIPAPPGSPPGARWAAMYVDSSWVVLSTLLGLVLLPTPTGRLPSPHWRWWAGWSWR
jgi:hypothetical protein